MTAIPASDNVFETLRMAEAAAPSTPPSAQTVLYTKSDGRIYWKDDAGTEYSVATLDDLSGVGGVTDHGALTGLGDDDHPQYLTQTEGDALYAAIGGGGGLSHAYIGYNTVGGSTETVQGRLRLKKVTLAADGLLTSIGVYIKQVTTSQSTSIAVACLTDNAGSPELLIGQNVGDNTSGLFLSTANGSAGAARWVHTPLGLWLPAGDYWLAVYIDGSTAYQVYYDGSGSDRYYTPGAFRMSDAGWTTVTTSSVKYSIRGSLLS